VAGERPDGAPVRRDAGAGEPGSSLGGGQVEGRAAVRALLVARERPVRTLFVAEGAREDELTELARASHVKVRTLRPDVHAMTTRSGAADGVFATAAPLFPVELDELVRPAGRSGPAAPVLIAVNRHLGAKELGLLLRLAGAAAVSGIVLPRGRSVPITPEVTATAEGAIERLPIALVASVPAALARIQEHGGVVIGVEEADDGHGQGHGQGLGALAVDAARAVVALVVDGAGALEGHVRSRCDAVVGVGPLPEDRAVVEGLAQLALAELARLRLAPDPWRLEPGNRA
jgi:tRNA G18 (ribose-2'-O)-methylase SpoU